MFTAWYDLIKSKFSPNREFVSLDAKQTGNDARNYELMKVASPSPIRAPDSAVTSPFGEPFSPSQQSHRTSAATADYFNKETQREYRSPTLSFSSPRTPSQTGMRPDWDLRSQYARGGLGLHPPEENEERNNRI